MKKKILLTALIVLSSGLLFTQSAHASTSGSNVVGGVDYSGQGTKLDNPINNKQNAYVSGDYVNVPVYKGMYTVKNSFTDSYLWKKKTDWSPLNYRQTQDLYSYIGDTITEYDVETRTEYQYKRWNDKKYVKYSTQYHTVYRGSKWWNCFVTIHDKSFDGYGINKNNYLIIERYTTNEKNGYVGGYDYDYKWRTSAPFRWLWENKWEAYNSRNSYRYQSRTLYWNKNANQGYEKVPLNYSLYDENEKPIEAGLVWTYNKSISKFKERNVIEGMIDDGMPNEANIDITQCYITDNELKHRIAEHILKDQGIEDIPVIDDDAFERDNGKSFFEKYKDVASFFLPFAIDKVSDGYITKNYGSKISIAYALVLFSYAQSSSNCKEELQKYCKKIGDSILYNKPLMVSYASTTASVLPKRKSRIAFSNIGKDVSMRYNEYFCRNNGCEFYLPNGGDYYGTITYYSKKEYMEFIEHMESMFDWDSLLL